MQLPPCKSIFAIFCGVIVSIAADQRSIQNDKNEEFLVCALGVLFGLHTHAAMLELYSEILLVSISLTDA